MCCSHLSLYGVDTLNGRIFNSLLYVARLQPRNHIFSPFFSSLDTQNTSHSTSHSTRFSHSPEMGKVVVMLSGHFGKSLTEFSTHFLSSHNRDSFEPTSASTWCKWKERKVLWYVLIISVYIVEATTLGKLFAISLRHRNFYVGAYLLFYYRLPLAPLFRIYKND